MDDSVQFALHETTLPILILSVETGRTKDMHVGPRGPSIMKPTKVLPIELVSPYVEIITLTKQLQFSATLRKQRSTSKRTALV